MYSLSRRTIDSLIPISVFCLVAPAIMLVLSVSIARAQGGGTDLSGTGGKHTIQGRIYFPSGRRVDSTIQVKLQSLVYPEITVFADMNGSFSFRSLAPASYTVVVDGGTDYEIARESVYIDGDISSSRTGISLPAAPRRYSVLVYLQPKVKSASSKPGVVNAALANVPVAARNLYQKGVESARAGDAKQAVEHLKGAIALYPDFPLALNELGLQYLKLAQSVKAVEALRAAVKLSPDAFTPRFNYGIALLEAKEFAEAESQLTQALKKNDKSATAHLYLGIALISLQKYDLAETSLIKAVSLGGDAVSLAHYYLGGIYWRKKEYKQAADELELYLKLAPKTADNERIRSTIKDLRSKS